MKKTLKTIVILSIALLLSNCGSNEVENVEETLFVKAEIDGANFSSDFPVVLPITAPDNILAIAAYNADNSISINIHIKNYAGSGTYTAGSTINNENAFIVSKNGSWFANKDYGNGTITINQDGKKLTGTFSFTGFNFTESSTKAVSNGSFIITIP